MSGCTHATDQSATVPHAFTAAAYQSQVEALTRSYGRGLLLVSVWSENADPQGRSSKWMFSYANTAQPAKEYLMQVDSTGVSLLRVSAMSVGSGLISGRWFDSDSALLFSERNGGALFRQKYLNCYINASVGEPVVPNPATTWWIRYYSPRDTTVASLLLGIDATTGAVTMKYPE